MLRLIILATLVFVSNVLLAEESVKYKEPTSAELQKQKDTVGEALKEAAKLRQNKKFLETISRQQSKLEGLSARPATSYDVPEYVNMARQKRYLDSIFNGELESNVDNSLPDRDKPLVLISLSMPDNEIRALLKELNAIGSGAVVRGLPENDIKVFADRIRKIADGDPALAGVSVDPTIFERFGIERVPAFIMPLSSIDACTPQGCPVPQFVKATGSVTLEYFLNAVTRNSENETEKSIAHYWLGELRENKNG